MLTEKFIKIAARIVRQGGHLATLVERGITPYALMHEAAQCPGCRSSRLTHLDIFTGKRPLEPGKFVWFFTGCGKCGLIFANPPRPDAEVAAAYEAGGSWRDRDSREADLAGTEKQQNVVTEKHQNAAVADTLIRLRDRRKLYQVLDYGCGDGGILDALQAAGCETYGIDPATEDQITRHTMLDAMPDRPTFDLIVMKHVLEHIPNPLGTLARARLCLNEGGLLLVATPTLDDVHRHGKKRYCLNRGHHVTAYTRRSLRQLLALAGFSILEEMPTDQLHRMALLAHTDQSPQLVRDPLRDARRALRRNAIAEHGWGALLNSSRSRAKNVNRRFIDARRAKGEKRRGAVA